jgi:hypothetical protein
MLVIGMESTGNAGVKWRVATQVCLGARVSDRREEQVGHTRTKIGWMVVR